MRRNFFNVDFCVKLLGYVIASAVLLINFLFIDNGVIPSDEGWYLCLLKYLPRDIGSIKYQLLFNDVFKNDIYIIRLSFWFFNLIAASVFAYGLHCFIDYYHETKHSFIWCLAVVFLGQIGINSQQVWFYVTLNMVVVEISLGVMLIAIVKKKCWLLIISGFAIGILFPTMFTNVVIIPFMIVAIFIMSNRRVKYCLIFILGLLIFFIYYFLFVDNINEYFFMVKQQSVSTIQKGRSDYGFIFLIKWLINSFLYIAKLSLAALIVCSIANMIKKSKLKFFSKYYSLFFILVAVFSLCYVWNYVGPSDVKRGREINDFYWFAIFLMLLNNNYRWNKKHGMVLLLLLFITPFCLCFGSNVTFPNRYGCYLMFLSPLVFLLPQNVEKEMKWLCYLFLMVKLIFLIASIGGTKWNGDKWLDQNIPLKTVGIEQNIKVDEKFIRNVEFCKSHMSDGDRVVCSFEFWAYVDILGYNPIDLNFNVSSNKLNEIIKSETENGNDFWIIVMAWQDDYIETIEKFDNYDVYFADSEVSIDTMILYHINANKYK